MGEIEPTTKNVPQQAGGGSKYNRVQQRLKDFAEDLDMAKVLLGQLAKRIDANASRAQGTASKSAATEFDKTPVAMASAVSTALGGAGVDLRPLIEKAAEVSAKAIQAQKTHQRLYEQLHKVRQRKERTPKPGAFVRPN